MVIVSLFLCGRFEVILLDPSGDCIYCIDISAVVMALPAQIQDYPSQYMDRSDIWIKKITYFHLIKSVLEHVGCKMVVISSWTMC